MCSRLPSRHSEDSAMHPHLRGSNLPLVVHLHRRSDYGLVCFRSAPRRIFGSYTNTVNCLQLDHATCTRRSTSLSMVPSVSITDPMYLKWSTFLISSPFSFICNEFPLLTDVLQSWCSVLATLFFRPWLHSVLCIIAMSPAHSISHGSSNSTYWDIVSTSMMNRNGLSAEPWWRPIPIHVQWFLA